jgi:hypothetical protein
MTTFRPTARQAAILLLLAVAAVAAAIYIRYRIIQNPEIGIVCDGGLPTLFCKARHGVVIFFLYSVFGWVALGAAVLNLIRPSVALLAVGLAAAGLGIVLYNVLLSAFAVAIMILVLARPARAASP